MGRDYQAYHRHSAAKSAHQKFANTVAQKGGIISVKDVRGKHKAKSKQLEDRLKKAEEYAEGARKKQMIAHGKKVTKRFSLVGKKAEAWANEWPKLRSTECNGSPPPKSSSCHRLHDIIRP